VASEAQKACPPCPAAPVCPIGNPLMLGIKYKELDNAFLNNTNKLINTHIDKIKVLACNETKANMATIPKFPLGIPCSAYETEFDKMVLGVVDPKLPPDQQMNVAIPKPVVDFLVQLRPEMKKAFCKPDGMVDNVAVDKAVQDAIKMFCN
jgi:hypothetical protein